MATGGYAIGYRALAHCGRCGDLQLLRYLMPDGQFPDLLVCACCYDPKHPQDYLSEVHDPETLYRPTGDRDASVANLLVVSYPPLKFIYGSDTPTTTSARPGTLSPPFMVPGRLALGLDTSDKFTITGGGVTDE